MNNNLKNPFVIEDMESGKKVIVATFKQFTELEGAWKQIARSYQTMSNIINIKNISKGSLIARNQEAFELI